MDTNILMLLAPAAGVLALLYAFTTAGWVGKQEAGTKQMKSIAAQITKGAMAFLSAEYKVLGLFVLLAAAALVGLSTTNAEGSPLIGLSFIVGAACSGAAGYLGMKVATQANVRTAAAARQGLSPALTVAFRGGAVMGMSVVGLALLGLGILFYVYVGKFNAFEAGGEAGLVKVVNLLAGFSMGASSIALFARVGGGIYTKAADVGADLVGKVEAGIPEDHPLNPATIADNVGDNVGDVAGMGADLFESYVASIIGAMILGATAAGGKIELVLMPLVMAAVGVVISVIATYFVKTKEGGNPQIALDGGSFGAAAVMLVASYFIIEFFLGKAANGGLSGAVRLASGGGGAIVTATTMNLMTAMAAGLAAGVAIGLVTGYYCSKGKPPVNSIVEQSMTGPATNLIAGISVGFRSTAIPILIICGAIFAADHAAGLYGVALAAVGMLSTTGIQLAVDAYGPISDNAGGIAEMAGLDPQVRERTDNLDAVGNTTAAIGKGFAIGSAALASLSLFAAYREIAFAGADGNMLLTDPRVLIGVLLGAMLPFLFSAMAMKAVGDAAMEMITEVRRQFREIKTLRPALALVKAAEDEDRQLTDEEQETVMAAAEDTDVERCVAISTNASLKRMVAPGLLALAAPIIVGFWSPYALGGLLVGTLSSGVMLAIFMSNAGGAWDNAKKQVEDQKKDLDPKVNTGKGSDRHHAAVIGDTVGDPFKDTAGPSLNILIKVMTVVAVVIAPFLSAT